MSPTGHDRSRLRFQKQLEQFDTRFAVEEDALFLEEEEEEEEEEETKARRKTI